MATATQTDDELIILEDDVNTEASSEEVIDFSAPEAAEDLVAEPEAAPKKKLSLGALMGGKKEEATEEVAEAAPVEESQDIVNLGESLEATSEASDLFSEPAEQAVAETVETPEVTTEVDSAEPVVDLFAEESKQTESEASLLDAQEEAPVAMFGESEVEQELDLVSQDSAEVSSEESVSTESEVSLLEDNVSEEPTAEASLLEETDSVEPAMDLFAESEVSEETNEVSLLEEASVETPTEEAAVVENEVSLLEDSVSEESTSEVSLLEDESSIFGGDDTSAQDDSQTGDDSAVADDESMNEILDATIAKLSSRKELIIKDKEADKAQIKERKAKIKELEFEISDFEETIKELGNEQRSITNNMKSLENMKLKAA